jgi:hypothetical protein
MKALALLLFASVALTIPTNAMGQSKSSVDGKELQATLQDDQRFAQLMTEIWVLRDVLALHEGGNLAAETTEFQGLQDQLRKQRDFIVSTISAGPEQMTLSGDLEKSSSSIALTLDRFGIRTDSVLGRRLVTAYMAFGQALSIGSLEPLCRIYPFRTQC